VARRRIPNRSAAPEGRTEKKVIPMTFRSAILAAIALAAPLVGAATASATDYAENFDAVAIGKTTTFTDSGITFSSPGNPGAFSVGATGTLFSTLAGNALEESASMVGSTLDITFSAPVNAVTLDFALIDFVGISDTLSFTTDTGATGTATAVFPAGNYLFPEGVLTYSGQAFSSIDLTADPTQNYQFAVDNIVATPEPASLGVLAMGLAGLAAVRRRRA
jgi:hypothetical protein